MTTEAIERAWLEFAPTIVNAAHMPAATNDHRVMFEAGWRAHAAQDDANPRYRRIGMRFDPPITIESFDGAPPPLTLAELARIQGVGPFDPAVHVLDPKLTEAEAEEFLASLEPPLEQQHRELRTRGERLAAALRALKRRHTVVEGDCWYTCPAATDAADGGDTCNDEKPRGVCDCGADATNATIDAALAEWEAVTVATGGRARRARQRRSPLARAPRPPPLP